MKLTKFIAKTRPWAKGLLAAEPQAGILSAGYSHALDGALDAIAEVRSSLFYPVIVEPDVVRKALHYKQGIILVEQYPTIDGGERSEAYWI